MCMNTYTGNTGNKGIDMCMNTYKVILKIKDFCLSSFFIESLSWCYKIFQRRAVITMILILT